MSGPAGVSTSARPSTHGTPPIRMRPPSPLSPKGRAVVGVVVVGVLGLMAVLVLQAKSADDGRPATAWSEAPLPPRGARTDTFAGKAVLGTVADFGTWTAAGEPWRQLDGYLVSTSDGQRSATVDAGTADVLVLAQIIEASPGGGVLFASSADGQRGLRLVAGEDGASWELLRSDPTGLELLDSFAAPTENVIVQVVRRGDRLRISIDDKGWDADAPAGAEGGTSVGVVATSPGTTFDLFGYLPLGAG